MSEAPEIHFEGKIAQKAIIEHKGKVLVIRDPREKELIWEIPGGRMNEGEEPRAGLQRELMEELGVSCEIHEVVHLEQFFQTNEGKNAFVIVYRATLRDMDAEFRLAEREVSDIQWIDKESLPTINLFPEYRRALEQFFSKKV
jgi:8-oxo-dGTP diphosphatase